tara:strand:+ start:606 stop:746 length:141 start_codon:yes stop_codon:yes gene_type:complete
LSKFEQYNSDNIVTAVNSNPNRDNDNHEAPKNKSVFQNLLNVKSIN